jgi:NADPH-dependent 2,4-dienoyl-CoA reductase/sulfur reductase-like enzyme
VVRDGTLIKLTGKKAATAHEPIEHPASVVIIGAGPAGAACAEALRREGYGGTLTMLGDEPPGPVDRPNLSKDYLAGTAPEEWIPLRTREFYDELEIDLVLGDPVSAIDLAKRHVRLASERVFEYGALLIATGAEPVRPPIEGVDLAHVHLLRTLADSRAIIEAAGSAKRVAIIGASFIGLEAAASLRKRNLPVTVIGPEAIPLSRVFGEELGKFVKQLHEHEGVEFRLGRKPETISADAVVLDDGTRVDADLVVVGVGVRPRTAIAQQAGLTVENGIVVDARLRTSAADVYAAGDVARYPYQGGLVRIEHFQVAVRQGQAVANAILERRQGFSDVPFFWSQHYDVAINYVGHAERFDEAVVRGNLDSRDAAVWFRSGGAVQALATIGRDRLSLDFERALEIGDVAEIESLFRSS